jgi:hypothetical protein
MNRFLGGFLAALLIFGAAEADDADGKITKINRKAMTITLDDGKSYRLPDEFDLEAISEGMEILIAFEEIGGVRQITDMAVLE